MSGDHSLLQEQRFDAQTSAANSRSQTPQLSHRFPSGVARGSVHAQHTSCGVIQSSGSNVAPRQHPCSESSSSSIITSHEAKRDSMRSAPSSPPTHPIITASTIQRMYTSIDYGPDDSPMELNGGAAWL